MTGNAPAAPVSPTAQDRHHIRLASNAWEAVMRAHSSVLKTFNSDGVFIELSIREYDVLYTLTKAGSDPQRICDIQNHVLLSQPALSRLIDKMVRQGLITREPDPADRRAALITLTAQGREIQRAVGSAHAKSIARLLGSKLTATEMEQLLELATKLAS